MIEHEPAAHNDAPEAAPVDGFEGIDQERFLRAIEAATTVRHRHQFYLWSQGVLQGVLPHSLLICTLREPTTGSLLADRFSTIPIPDDAFKSVCSSGTGLLARMTSTWAECGGRPLLLRAGESRFREVDELSRSFGFASIAMHGTFDQSGAPSSGFVFFDVHGLPPAQCNHLLELLVPYLHCALVRVSIDPRFESMVPYNDGTLTLREIEILRYVQRGMSNTAIGSELSISPLTVKNHVQKILRKLAVANRAQAVVKATMLRVIPPLSRPTND